MTDRTWTIRMYVVSVVGAITGILYPTLIVAFKGTLNTATTTVTAVARTLFPPATDSGFGMQGVDLTAAVVAVALLAVLATLIGIIVATLAFFPFLSDDTKRTQLRALGLLAYFSAFAIGFAAGLGFENAATAG